MIIHTARIFPFVNPISTINVQITCSSVKIFLIQGMTDAKDRFSQTPEAYLQSHHVVTYLNHALTSLYTVKDSDPKLQPFRYLSDYFARVSAGNHVIHQEYSYVSINPHNRASFVKLFWKVYKSIGNHGDLLTAKEYHALMQLLCPDFPFTIVQSAARIILMDDAISDCLMAFQDFLYAFQVQFCYNEFLNACRELYLSLSSDKGATGGGTTPRLEGVESSIFLDGITDLIANNSYHHPSIRVIHRVLGKSLKASFYTYLLGIANSDTINASIGVLPKKGHCLDSDSAAKSTKSDS